MSSYVISYLSISHLFPFSHLSSNRKVNGTDWDVERTGLLIFSFPTLSPPGGGWWSHDIDSFPPLSLHCMRGLEPWRRQRSSLEGTFFQILQLSWLGTPHCFSHLWSPNGASREQLFAGGFYFGNHTCPAAHDVGFLVEASNETPRLRAIGEGGEVARTLTDHVKFDTLSGFMLAQGSKDGRPNSFWQLVSRQIGDLEWAPI